MSNRRWTMNDARWMMNVVLSRICAMWQTAHLGTVGIIAFLAVSRVWAAFGAPRGSWHKISTLLPPNLPPSSPGAALERKTTRMDGKYKSAQKPTLIRLLAIGDAEYRSADRKAQKSEAWTNVSAQSTARSFDAWERLPGELNQVCAVEHCAQPWHNYCAGHQTAVRRFDVPK